MKLSIHRRLQLYFVCFALFLLLVMTAVVNMRVKSDFINYLTEEKHRSLNNLANSIQQHYAADPVKWQQFISQPHLYEQAVDKAFANFAGQTDSSMPQPPLSPPPSTKLPKHNTPRPDLADASSPKHKPPHTATANEHKHAPPPNWHSKKRPVLPVALLDTQGKVIYGHSTNRNAKTHFLSPIGDAQGKIIATLTLPKNTSFASLQQQAYLNTLKRTLWIILVVGVLFSLLVAGFLAKAFTQPLERLTKAAKALENRHFHTRLPIESHDELGQLSQAFNQMADKLAAYESQQRMWLGNISHDLRTPVAVLKAEVEALLDGIKKPTVAAFESLFQEISSLSVMLDHFHQAAMQDIRQDIRQDIHQDRKQSTQQQMSQHVQPATQDSKPHTITKPDTITEANTVNTANTASVETAQNINPSPVLHQLTQRSQQSISNAGLTLHTQWHSDNVLIPLTELAFTQIWQNLLQNSLRYTDAKGSIHITSQVAKHTFTLTWQDSSPSVADDMLAKLTQPLFRVEQSRNRTFAGSGLGLSIVKNLVVHAGGHIQLSQSELGGLAVIISLPCESAT